MEILSMELALVNLVRLGDSAVSKPCSSIVLSTLIRLIHIDVLCFVDADTASSQSPLMQSGSVSDGSAEKKNKKTSAFRIVRFCMLEALVA